MGRNTIKSNAMICNANGGIANGQNSMGCNAIRHNTIERNNFRCDAIICNTIGRNAIRCNAIGWKIIGQSSMEETSVDKNMDKIHPFLDHQTTKEFWFVVGEKKRISVIPFQSYHYPAKTISTLSLWMTQTKVLKTHSSTMKQTQCYTKATPLYMSMVLFLSTYSN